MVNFGLLPAEIILLASLGRPWKFQRVRVLAELLHGTRVLGTSQTLRLEHRAPAIFGRATITLAIGPHSSSIYYGRPP